MRYFIHCDLNKFYSSIIHSFKPWLSLTPTITLSNNDGCNICFKPGGLKHDIGIKMGTPIFEVDNIVKQYCIEVYSCNFPLIADMSLRVKSILGRFFENIEDYSIDEIFCEIDAPLNQIEEMCREARRVIGKGLGLPISIGVSHTKTLAKVATRFAKKHPGYGGICTIDTDYQRKKALSLTELGDIWGIGKKQRKKLNRRGIFTTLDWLEKMTGATARKVMGGVVAERTYRELEGISCLELEMIVPKKKNIMVSRSFGENITDPELIAEALASYVMMLTAKLRKQRSKAQAIYVFLETNRFRENDEQAEDEIVIKLPVASSSDIEVGEYARIAIKAMFRKGLRYKKTGIMAMQLCDEEAIQGNFMDRRDRAKEDRLMQAKDKINARWGANTVKPLSVGLGKRPWHIRQEKLPPYWSTRIADIPVVTDYPLLLYKKQPEKEQQTYINMIPIEGIYPTVLRAV